MRILLYILFFTASFSISAQVQDTTAVVSPQEIIYDLDTTKEVRKFNKERLREFALQDDFNYTELEETDTWWTQFKKWFGQLWNKLYEWLFGTGAVATGFLSFFLLAIPYIIVIAIVCLLIYLFMKVNPKDMLLEKQQASQVIITEDEDIIHNQDIQELIKQALEKNNHRLAIRYYYLSVLKKMSDQELIVWESQKTNTDYTKELTDSAIKQQFQNITRLYDFIWYGSFEVDEKSFHTAEQKFKSLTNRITSHFAQ
ncbi:DUF4129 domain-containing protein [Aquimarina sp. RZ0]|uniref:DUF4129 domain-containing protein n=1 Tax=Aquimarina sp. RZ0 TaxID=2607730 RepID=UPI0011F3DF70|nr:DUF4129 domain-containing protein [Aquimarina sp. RZ0]KAA1244273.1 DUF4129 domain-containing protein [Aquimarina sp. RZ0]